MSVSDVDDDVFESAGAGFSWSYHLQYSKIDLEIVRLAKGPENYGLCYIQGCTKYV